MDNSATTLTEKNEGHSDHINVKSKDHSPTRSSIKSFKANVGTKASIKSIPKFGGNKLALKGENKSQNCLFKAENQRVTSVQQTNKKTISSVTTKSPNSSTPAGKSKIPAIKRSPSNNIDIKTKTVAQQKSPGPTQQQQKPVTQRPLPEKKPLELKRQPVTRSNSKASISRSESSQINKMASSISKSSFVTSPALPKQKKRILKSQSARSSLESPVVVTNKRSASNISAHSIPYPTSKTEYETNLRKTMSTAGDHKKTESLEMNLQPKQTEFLQKTENLKEAAIDKFKTSEKVDDFKNKIQMYMEQWFSCVKDELRDSKEDNAIQEKLEHFQILKSHDILTLIDDFCAANNENSNLQVVKLKKELEESTKSSKEEEKKYNDWIKQQEEERFKWEKDIEEKAQADIAKKAEELKELQKKSKISDKEFSNLKAAMQNLKKEKENLFTEKDQLQEDLINYKESIAISNKKLQQVEQQLSHEKKELKAKTEIIKKLESDLEDKKKLEINLKQMSAKLEELEIKIKNKSQNECKEHLKQISELTNKINCLEKAQENIQQENGKLKEELQELEEVKDKLKQTEIKMQNLQKEYESKEKSLETMSDCSKEGQLEFAKLRQSDQEKRREIEKLKVELSKAQFNICQQEQQIQRDLQLLEVRSELIKSLQANEKTHRIHMEELFAQVGEKNTTINELNCELQNKSEEFRNLFNSLSAKQVEVSNQEHIIKLLEESNERSQLLRVKQEEKISRMEEELAHLKQTIGIYQTNIFSANHGKHLLLTPVLPPSNVDYNENFYYYVNQRKRKRQVDINVKKYEA